MSDFWHFWIIILTAAALVLVTWILVSNRTREGSSHDDGTTGHEYDGITELENPLPAWWYYLFLGSVIWAVGYLVFFPGMGQYKGLLGWTQESQYEARVETAEAAYSERRKQYLDMPIEEVAKDPLARKMGMRMFQNNCAQCHGADAKGSYGFPNLTDDDWIYGGAPDVIATTIRNGRQAAMPAWGSVIGEDGVVAVSDYVVSLSADAAAAGEGAEEAHAAGKKVFTTYCVACHGPEAKGNPLLGAPNLVDNTWLYGHDIEQIRHSIRSGRNGMMPSHSDLLGEDKIHILAAYVYGLSQ